MKALKALVMSMGMFSTFPVPQSAWNDDCMRLVIPCLPVVGAIIGGIWYFASLALVNTASPILIQSALIMLLPFVLSGFLHIDGLMDTSDAIFSRRDIEEKRRILKDSRVGAFGVIALVSLFLLQFSAVFTIVSEKKGFIPFVFISVMSRGVAGIALLNIRPMSENGLAAAFKAGTTPRHTAFIALTLAFVLLCAYWCGGAEGLLPLSAALVAGIIAAAYVCGQLRGISGDLCGCIITVSEAAGLLCLAVI